MHEPGKDPVIKGCACNAGIDDMTMGWNPSPDDHLIVTENVQASLE